MLTVLMLHRSVMHFVMGENRVLLMSAVYNPFTIIESQLFRSRPASPGVQLSPDMSAARHPRKKTRPVNHFAAQDPSSWRIRPRSIHAAAVPNAVAVPHATPASADATSRNCGRSGQRARRRCSRAGRDFRCSMAGCRRGREKGYCVVTFRRTKQGHVHKMS